MQGHYRRWGNQGNKTLKSKRECGHKGFVDDSDLEIFVTADIQNRIATIVKEHI